MAFKRSGKQSSGEKKEYDNTNRGALWIADNADCLTPDPEEQHGPELRGVININGVDHWLSAFITLKDEDARGAMVELLSDLYEFLEEQREELDRKKQMPLLRVTIKEIEPQEDEAPKAKSKTATKKATGLKSKKAAKEPEEPPAFTEDEIPF